MSRLPRLTDIRLGKIFGGEGFGGICRPKTFSAVEFSRYSVSLRQLSGPASGDFPLPLVAPPCFERDEPPLPGERLCQAQSCFFAALDGAGTRSVDVAGGDRGVRPAVQEPV